MLDRGVSEDEQGVVAKFEVIGVKPQTIKNGWTLRAFASFTRDLLMDVNAWRRPLVLWQKDNGLGEDGVCPVHRYQHLQIYPPGREPMKCYEAMVVARVKENARF